MNRAENTAGSGNRNRTSGDIRGWGNEVQVRRLNLKRARAKNRNKKREKKRERQGILCAISNTGFVFKMNNGAVSWSSKRQATVALSSAQAKYMAFTQTTKEATWLRLLMTEIGLLESDDQHAQIRTIENESAIAVNGDNQGSIALANIVFH